MWQPIETAPKVCVDCTWKGCSFEGQLINEVECDDFVSETDIELLPA